MGFALIVPFMSFQFVPKDSYSPADPMRAPRLSLREEAIDFASCESLYYHGRNVHDKTVPADYVFESRRSGASWCLQMLEAENTLGYVEGHDWPQGRTPDVLAVFIGGPSSAGAPSPARVSEALAVLLRRPGLAVHFLPNWSGMREWQRGPRQAAVPPQSPQPVAHSYRVVVEGVADGVHHEPVAARLAIRFRRPEQEMLAMVKMDKAVVKRGISFDQAQEYFAVLTDAGCATLVEKEDGAPAAPARMKATS